MGGDIQSQKVIYKVTPTYPAAARAARIQGSVILQVTITDDGHVSDAKLISSTDPLLEPGVEDAVRQWVYSPTLLNGQPVAVVTTVTVNFSLTAS